MTFEEFVQTYNAVRAFSQLNREDQRLVLCTMKGMQMETNETKGTETGSDKINMTEIEASIFRAKRVFESRNFKDKAHEDLVGVIKHNASALWAAIDAIPVGVGNYETARMVDRAKTELESSVMWAVKALSRQ